MGLVTVCSSLNCEKYLESGMHTLSVPQGDQELPTLRNSVRFLPVSDKISIWIFLKERKKKIKSFSVYADILTW